jgi:prolyl-tRNA synthetase
MEEKKELKKRSENLSEWYTDVIQKAEIADYGPVKGTMVFRPYGYAIWEIVQSAFNEFMKEADVSNAYFPMFIPMSLINREKEHVEGFSPELAVVTKAGGEDLAEPIVVRPTSETIMYHMYKKWISSWRDLPMKINQWNSVVRWEKRTHLFLRTSEFLWQEGHTAHETEGEALDMVLLALEWYRRIYEDYFALPALLGIKSESEKFAGAKTTYTIEALMPDGKALQAATSHNLGQNFSKAFEITFQNRESKSEFVWQTSWGMSWRALGGLFMTHGDDHGLILPPRVATYQVVVVPVITKNDDPGLRAYIEEIVRVLAQEGVRVHVDDRDGQSMGRKINEWEVKGVPIRIEVGPQEVANESVTVVRRDDGEKLSVGLDDLIDTVNNLLDGIQDRMYQNASKFLADNIHEVNNYDEFKNIMSGSRGFIRALWCGDPECENKIKEETKATTRLRRIDEEEQTGECIYCRRPASQIWYFAQAY